MAGSTPRADRQRGAMAKGPDLKDAAKLWLATLFYVAVVVLSVWRLWE